ncbi:s-adenosylmethionine synthetase [Holotrichia oblita]|nr:s-adenosylmethionine synthetase [Holotrichia oblita]
MRKLFTSESVTEGHPDKLCDQVADAVLDALLAQDPYSRVACECAATTGMVLVMGEITTNGYADIPSIVRNVVKDIGYCGPTSSFDGNTCAVLTAIDEQSPDISMGVSKAYEAKEEGLAEHVTGAGDQGMMFGFACNETEDYMPMSIYLAHKLTAKLTEIRKNGVLKYLRPDGKSQVTVEYDGDKPVRIDTVVISTQHSEDASLETIRNDEDLLWKFCGDSGVTGRKIIVDTYGGFSRHGGGAFSGKDPTKVDRSASYAARYVAKNIVAAGLADKCEIQLSYAIGVAKPISVRVDTFGTGKVSEDIIVSIVDKLFDLTPDGIIKMLDLRRPIYRKTVNYGHFGRNDEDFTWERLDKVDAIKAIF